MSLSINKILLANASSNTAGAYFEPVTIASVGAGNSTAMGSSKAIPIGQYILLPTANVTIEYNAYTGSANSWSTWIAANTGATIFSDGYNVRANATTGTQSVTLYGANDGQAATQSSYATS